MKTQNRVLPFFLAIIMLIALIPVNILADEEETSGNPEVPASDTILDDDSEGQDITSSVIRKAEIRTIASDPDSKIADLNAMTSENALTVGTEYYLYLEFADPCETDNTYVDITLGTPDSNGVMVANGLSFTNIPGSQYAAGDITHNSFSSILSYTDIADVTYGKNKLPYTMKDGTLRYLLKDTIQKDEVFSCTVGFISDSAFWGGENQLTNAIHIDIGSISAENQTTSMNSLSTGVFLQGTRVNNFTVNNSSLSATIGKNTTGISFYLGYAGGQPEYNPAILYKSLEFDIYYPSTATIKTITNGEADYIHIDAWMG